MAFKFVKNFRILQKFHVTPIFWNQSCFGHGGELGSGVGKGGGSGGTVREAGGSMGKQGAAQEEEYFRKVQNQQLNKLKDHVSEEIRNHEKWIERHKESIKHYKKQLKELDDID